MQEEYGRDLMYDLFPSATWEINCKRYYFYIDKDLLLPILVKLDNLVCVTIEGVALISKDTYRIDVYFKYDTQIGEAQGILDAIGETGKHTNVPDIGTISTQSRLMVFKTLSGMYEAIECYNVTECYTQDELKECALER